MQSWYKISEADGTAVLNVGDDILVGPQTLAKYEQNGGTVNVDGNLEIWKARKRWQFQLRLPGVERRHAQRRWRGHQPHWLLRPGWWHSQHAELHQRLAQGFNIDNNADFRANTLSNTQGTVTMYRNAKLHGKLAFPPDTYWLCQFTNDGTFQMAAPRSMAARSAAF